MDKYMLAVVPFRKEWKVIVGPIEKPLCIVPCVKVLRSDLNEMLCKKIALEEHELETELEIEPGMESVKIIDKNAELDFIKNQPQFRKIVRKS
jgi:hypothetical protein